MPGQRGTVEEAHRRNVRIAELRAHGLTWREISADVGIDERQARRSYSDYVAFLGENGPLGTEAIHDVLERIDEVVANATKLYTAHENRKNANAQIGALRVILRAQSHKIALLGLAGASEQDAQRWQADRAAFRQFTETGIDLLLAVRDGTTTADVALEKFEAALGLLGTPAPVQDMDIAPTAPRPTG